MKTKKKINRSGIDAEDRLILILDEKTLEEAFEERNLEE